MVKGVKEGLFACLVNDPRRRPDSMGSNFSRGDSSFRRTVPIQRLANFILFLLFDTRVQDVKSPIVKVSYSISESGDYGLSMRSHCRAPAGIGLLGYKRSDY